MIITKIPNASGAHPAPQNWNKPTPPDGYAVIHDTVDMADFYSHNGFVTLTIEAIEHTRQVDKIVAVEKTKQVEDITYNENDEEVCGPYAATCDPHVALPAHCNRHVVTTFSRRPRQPVVQHATRIL